MRKLILLSAIAAGAMFSTKANAQIGLSLGLHFGNGYGPTGHIVVSSPAPVVYTEPVVYNDYADDDYYYLPDVDAYYDVTGNVYFYNDGRRWVSAAYLPGHRDYDWRSGRRYEIRESRPYLNHSYYSARFNDNRGGWNNEPRRYDNRGNYGRNENFDRDNRFNGRSEERFDNRGGNNNYNRPQGNFDRGRGDNRPQGGFNQPQSQPQPQNRQQGGGFNQPQQNDRGNSQPAQPTQPAQPAQDGRGRGGNERATGGGKQRFSENPAQGGMHRIARM